MNEHRRAPRLGGLFIVHPSSFIVQEFLHRSSFETFIFKTRP
jgi:hypothetical protein